MDRPSVDVVVPFGGNAAGLPELLSRLSRLSLSAGDSLTVVHNPPRAGATAENTSGDTSSACASEKSRTHVMTASQLRGSYYARNRGAAVGSADWLLFLDADVDAPADLLEHYFAQPVDPRTAVLAGAIIDEPATDDAPPSLRYASLKHVMSHTCTLTGDDGGYAQTANCAVRREAFTTLGGFREHVRSGADADLCFRLREAGWELRPRPAAVVVHRNRTTIGGLLAQLARHGAGAAWLGREHPGRLPRRRWPGLAWWSLKRTAQGIASLLRGDRDAAITGLLDGPSVWAFELGRLLGNEARPPRSRRLF